MTTRLAKLGILVIAIGIPVGLAMLLWWRIAEERFDKEVVPQIVSDVVLRRERSDAYAHDDMLDSSFIKHMITYVKPQFYYY